MYLDFISQNYVHSRTRERSTIKILESGEKQKTKIGSQPPLSNIIYPEDILSSNQPFIQSMKNVTPSIYPSERKSNQPLSVYRYYFLEKAIRNPLESTIARGLPVSLSFTSPRYYSSSPLNQPFFTKSEPIVSFLSIKQIYIYIYFLHVTPNISLDNRDAK